MFASVIELSLQSGRKGFSLSPSWLSEAHTVALQRLFSLTGWRQDEVNSANSLCFSIMILLIEALVKYSIRHSRPNLVLAPVNQSIHCPAT